MKKVLKVAIIGAGAAGLCALRHLTHSSASESTHFVVVCFEQAPRVGGTWFYTEKVGKDEFGLPVHSSMYENLRTNLPKECMAFPDYQFPELPSFVEHGDVQKYLEDYAAHFDVLKYIKFQTIVTLVKPVSDNENKFGTSWEVTTKSGTDFSEEETTLFDAILVCNGHYSVPFMPEIPGLDSFSGEVMHSHNYRRPSVFSGKRVVLLGAAASGQDISLEVSTVAKQVFLSHNNKPLKTPLPVNVRQTTGIRKVNKNCVEFLDGSQEEVDALLLCTGYYYAYNFLAPECGVEVTNNRVTPLYKHFIHTKYPNFGLIGVCKLVVPFPMFDVQVRFFRSILDGTLVLPSEEDMNRDTEEDYRSRIESGMNHRHAHVMSERQFNYNDELADMAQTTRLPEHFKQLCQVTQKLRQENLTGYKNVNFVLDEKEDTYHIDN